MKATLSFNLEDPDDRRAHLRCVKAEDMAQILWDIQFRVLESSMDKVKTLEEKDDISRDAQVICAVLEEINNLLERHSINIDDLII